MSNQHLWWCHTCNCRMPKEHSCNVILSPREQHARRQELRRKYKAMQPPKKDGKLRKFLKG